MEFWYVHIINLVYCPQYTISFSLSLCLSLTDFSHRHSFIHILPFSFVALSDHIFLSVEIPFLHPFPVHRICLHNAKKNLLIWAWFINEIIQEKPVGVGESTFCGASSTRKSFGDQLSQQSCKLEMFQSDFHFRLNWTFQDCKKFYLQQSSNHKTTIHNKGCSLSHKIRTKLAQKVIFFQNKSSLCLH